jgi:hypothetical protein
MECDTLGSSPLLFYDSQARLDFRDASSVSLSGLNWNFNDLLVDPEDAHNPSILDTAQSSRLPTESLAGFGPTHDLSCSAPMDLSGGHPRDMEHGPHHQPTSNTVDSNRLPPEQLASRLPSSRKGEGINSAKRKRSVQKERNWNDDETSALLKFVNLPEYRSDRGTPRTQWGLIAGEIQRELGAGPAITGKRCQERMKTLTGNRYLGKVDSEWKKKTARNDNLTSADWHETIKDCNLTVDWYNAIKEYKDTQGRHRMQRRGNIDLNLTPDGPDRPSSSRIPTLSDPLDPVQPTSPQNAGKSITKHVVSFASSQLLLKRTLAVVLL